MTWGRRSRPRRAAIGICLAAVLLSACHAAPRTVPQRPDSPARQQLRRDLDAILAAPPLERGYWGVLVKSLKTDETLYALNARKLMMPASNLKIVTLAAAAERLGWDFTYKTTLVAAGAIDNGILTGDLLVVGTGDPSITNETAQALFADWAERLKSAGISTITGRIVGNDNAFDDEPLGAGWSWDDVPEAYAAGVGALQFNENMAHLTVTPGSSVGASVEASVEPAASGLVMHNDLITGAADSTGIVRLRRWPGQNDLEFRGSLPLGSPTSVRLVSVNNPTLFFVSALRSALVANGIDVRGPAVDIDEIADPPMRDSGVSVVSHDSPPLSTLAIRLMKSSQNQYAETLLRSIGAASASTVTAGLASAAEVTRSWGLADGDVIQRDGSGLSRYNYMTPDAVVHLLVHVDRDERLRGPYEASLPIAGVDGSLANRMKGTAAAGNARAKTGSMANVRALSGYVTTSDGEPLVFAILANNFEAAGDVVTNAADAIVVRLAQFRRVATETPRH